MFLLLSLLACFGPYPGACEDFYASYCDVCETSDEEAISCSCIENGTLTADDYPKGRDISDDEAAQACSEILYYLQYPSPDDAASCKQGFALLKDYDNDACDFAY